MLADYQKLKARMNIAIDYKMRWLNLNTQAYQLITPDRDAFNVLFNYRDDGKPTTTQIWDDTAQLAAKQRANDLHSMLLPSDRVWGKLTVNPHKVDADTINLIQPQLDKINDTLFWYLNQSNLNRAANASLMDLNISTAAIWVESPTDDNPLAFTAIPGICVFIEQTMDDIIRTAWYTTKKTGRNILDNFPDYKGLQKQALIDNPNQDFKVNYGQIQLGEDEYLIYAIMTMDEDNPLFEKTVKVPRLIIYRDQIRPGEADGRGIGLDMYPTISNLNKLMASYTQSMAYRANPVLFNDSNQYQNPFAVVGWSGAMMKVLPGTNPIRPMEMPEFPSVLQEIQYLTEKVNQAFAVNPLGDLNSPVKTAEEISIRQDEAQRTSQTDISRLINELPKQVYHITGKLLMERGLLPKITMDSLTPKQLEVIQKAITFEYISPLVDIQNQEDLANAETALQLIEQYFGEQALSVLVNMGNLTEFLTEKCNIPANLLKNEAQIKAAMAQMVKYQNAQNAQQNGQPQNTASITPQQPQGLAA